MTTSADVRAAITRTLRRDLIGPGLDDEDIAHEILPTRPSRWYLTGYLVPAQAPPEQRTATGAAEGELDGGNGEGAEGLDDSDEPDTPTARPSFLPSSIGLSFLLPEGVNHVEVTARWGDYRAAAAETAEETPLLADPANEAEDAGEDKPPAAPAAKPRRAVVWRRTPKSAAITLALPEAGREEQPIPGSAGLVLSVVARKVTLNLPEGPTPARSVALFLVNRRPPHRGRYADQEVAFQAALHVHGETPFIARPDPRGYGSADADEALADLHYRDAVELAVGHNVSADWTMEDGQCRDVCTSWVPMAIVPRVVSAAPADVDCELRMQALGALTDAAAARQALAGLTRSYRDWIAAQRGALGGLAPKRRAVAEQLLANAEMAADRIEDGVACLADPVALEAFCIANRTVAEAGRRRMALERGVAPASITPSWRPFQLAFLLLNIKGLVEPGHTDRQVVDLLFFPTGGGKTEAYLGLAAFTIALRRLRNVGQSGAGLTVLMRYTLRLLTLDQLGRAAGVVCALELERQAAAGRLGSWPIEIGLWVGSGATPNRMGRKGEPDPRRRSIRTKVLDFVNNTKKPQPLPIERCPWCGTLFGRDSFKLAPNSDAPTRLDLFCVNRNCDFHASHSRPLPLHAVDEPIYRRLPAFMIATVDKFAAMPWTGEVAGFFGLAERCDADGFYSAAEPGRGQPLPRPLLPPDLVIQDELHLISGPLGSMTGLYETALDALCTRRLEDGREIRPKIVASTATVRSAKKQIGALFDRPAVQVFPPPGPDRRDSFFAKGMPEDDPGGRLYLGLAAPGVSPRVVFLRALVTLMSAAQYGWNVWAGPPDQNPADPYMTLIAYFNALRELAASRRLVEEQVRPRLEGYGARKRIGETDAGLANRTIAYEPAELTSRIATNEVSVTKDKLAAGFADPKRRVDVALATNMISVGLDILRLGLMVVTGQPKTTAEYIQATSRVGRDERRPGVVVAALNVNKPRDRSHYERFRAFHGSFYRSVEPTSVTPFSPRALDRGLAAITVALARLGTRDLTPQTAAGKIAAHTAALAMVKAAVSARAGRLDPAQGVQAGRRVQELLDIWTALADEIAQAGGTLGYGRAGVARSLLHEVLEPKLTAGERKFRAGRSLRDVEPGVLIEIM